MQQATNCYGEPLVKIRLIPFRQNRSSGFTRSLPSAKIVAFPVHETPIYIPSYRPGVSLYMVRPTQTSGHSSRIHVLYHRVEKIGAFSISQDSLCTLKVLIVWNKSLSSACVISCFNCWASLKFSNKSKIFIRLENDNPSYLRTIWKCYQPVNYL